MKSRKVDLRRLGGLVVLFTAVTALGSAAAGVGEPWSIAAGGAVVWANYHLIRMLVSQLIRPQLSKVWAVIVFIGKLALFFLLVAGAFYRLPIEPMSFAVGATQLLLATVVEALIMGEPIEPLNENGESRSL